MKMQANSIHGIRVVCFETTWTCAYAMCKCVGISISIFRFVHTPVVPNCDNHNNQNHVTITII